MPQTSDNSTSEANSEEVFGHKVLFQLHSEYFDALFKNLMDFAHFQTKTPLDKDQIMEIPLYSIDSKEFLILKDFIYHSKVSVEIGDEVLLVLVLANKVCLIGL